MRRNKKPRSCERGAIEDDGIRTHDLLADNQNTLANEWRPYLFEESAAAGFEPATFPFLVGRSNQAELRAEFVE